MAIELIEVGWADQIVVVDGKRYGDFDEPAYKLNGKLADIPEKRRVEVIAMLVAHVKRKRDREKEQRFGDDL